MIYYLALDYRPEGWSLIEYESLELVIESIQKGNTDGRSFKIFKEIEIKLEEKK